MTVLLDTDVLIDCLRGTPAARVWLEQAESQAFQVPGVVAMELLMGCRNKVELERARQFLHAFGIAWPEASEFALAYKLLAARHLSSGLGIPDCLVAAMALSRSARLYTFNLKHLQTIEGLDVHAPYAR